jgi:hypothetical protein
MDDTLCERFFCQPAQRLHRRYEALRAVFVEHRPLAEVAQQYGYRYGSLRNLVTEFRAQCQCGSVPPFSPTRPAVVPRGVALAGPLPPRSCQRSLTANNSPLPQGGNCVAALPASSCSCRYWRGSVSTNWPRRPATPARRWSQPPLPC